MWAILSPSSLETTFIVFRLPSYSRNLRKRVVKMPKLHFYDTGLVSWLLGIRSVAQLRAHPLRGALFETWVASEILKQRAHRGEPAGHFTYRDSHGAEADLVVAAGETVSLVEVQSGATVSSDMLDAVRKVRPGLASRTPPEAVLIYGGETLQKRADVTVLPWTAIHDRRRTRRSAGLVHNRREDRALPLALPRTCRCVRQALGEPEDATVGLRPRLRKRMGRGGLSEDGGRSKTRGSHVRHLPAPGVSASDRPRDPAAPPGPSDSGGVPPPPG
ncbi:MAG: DUF4143 domain-containing protein [candidate division NC10 bacterium]|nr:DUF4143 domain-containing protein [candidate division NC10 bacterium]